MCLPPDDQSKLDASELELAEEMSREIRAAMERGEARRARQSIAFAVAVALVIAIGWLA